MEQDNSNESVPSLGRRSTPKKKSWLAKNFANDKDGFSARDFMMSVFTFFYIIQHIALLILSVTVDITDYTMEIADNVNIAFIAIICGVFSVDAAEVIGLRRQR